MGKRTCRHKDWIRLARGAVGHKERGERGGHVVATPPAEEPDVGGPVDHREVLGVVRVGVEEDGVGRQEGTGLGPETPRPVSHPEGKPS